MDKKQDNLTNSEWVILKLVEERNDAKRWSAVWKQSSKWWREVAQWEEEMSKFQYDFLRPIAKAAVDELCNCCGFSFYLDRHSENCAYRVAVEKELSNE